MKHYYNDFSPEACAWVEQLIMEGLIPDGDVDCRSITEIQPNELTEYVSCHFFCGIAGWSLALHLAGWPTDKPVWTGSCPCQPFSSAGRQKGTDDERHLWPAFHRLIAECLPPTVFGEQVASAKVVGKVKNPSGEVWVDGVRSDLERAGYAFGSGVLGAHSAGAPHIRQRLYWVAERVEKSLRTGAGGLGRSSCDEGGEPVGSRGEGLRQGDGPLGAGGVGAGGAGSGMANPHRQRPPGVNPLLRAEEAGRDEGGVSEAAGGSDDGRVANSSRPRLEGHNTGPRQTGEEIEPGEQVEQFTGHGDDGRVANSDAEGRERDGRRRGGGHEGGNGGEEAERSECGEGVEGLCVSGRLEHTEHTGSQGHCGDGDDGDQPGRDDPQPDRPTCEPSAKSGWDASIWHPCRDGKARRIPEAESGIFPVVDDGRYLVPEVARRRTTRPPLLRGSGNAIVPQTAAEFVQSYLEATEV